MKRNALQLVRSIYRANKSTHKKEHLETFLDEFEILKLEIRLCTDMKVLPYKKQAVLKGGNTVGSDVSDSYFTIKKP